jgi:hypothetical protein
LGGPPEEWPEIAPLTGADDPEMLERLRQAYRRGVTGPELADVGAAAQRLLDLLIQFDGIDEAPADGRVPPGTFFAGGGT